MNCLREGILRLDDDRAEAMAALEHIDCRKCAACGERYGGKDGFAQVFLPDEAWLKISPTGRSDGLLCCGCIERRLKEAYGDGRTIIRGTICFLA